MTLTLSVLTYRNQPPSRAISQRLRGAGGTIGRLSQNDLVLPDPEKIISRTHARIDFRDGTYFITRLGQNAIDLNGRALPGGASEQLSSGDRLTIGDYCVVVDIESPAPADLLAPSIEKLVGPLPGHADFDTPWRESGSEVAFGINLVGGEAASVRPENPLSEHAPVSSHGVQHDEVPGHREPLPSIRVPPATHIPDDYDPLRDLQRSPPAATAVPGQAPSARPMTPEFDPFAGAVPADPALATPHTEASAMRRAVPDLSAQREEAGRAAAPGGDYARAVRTLLQAAGVPELEERALGDPDFMRTVGELLREAIAGLLKALIARASTKRELRVDVTMLAATENNPLKFSPDAYEALLHLLVKSKRPGYLPPVRAVREAYDDLQAHNLAVMAGVKAALQEVLQRFDPPRLEQRLRSRPLLDQLLPAHRKARLWELAAEQHADLMREAQDDFDRIFGRAFRIAYEEQVRKIHASAGKPPLP